jgi:hypothetical protein
MPVSPAAPPSGTGPTNIPAMGLMPSLAPPAPSLAAIPPIPGTLAAIPPIPGTLGAPIPPPPPRSPMAATMGPSSSARMPVAAVSSVNPIASTLEPAPTPRDRRFANDLPTATNTQVPVVNLDPDLYADETETDRKFFDAAPYRDPASSSRMQAAGSRTPASSSRMPASNPNGRTQEPDQFAQLPTIQAFRPVKIGSPEDLEEPTESRNALSDEVLRSIREDNKTPLPPVPEEETQQLEMTPELRAKIEAQYAARPVPPAPAPSHQGHAQPHRQPMSSEMDSIPPPTKRLDK